MDPVIIKLFHMACDALEAADNAVEIAWGPMDPVERETKLRKCEETCAEFVECLKWNFSDIVAYERSVDYEKDQQSSLIHSIEFRLLYKIADINIFKKAEVFAEIYKEIEATLAAIDESVDALNAPSGKRTKAALRTADGDTD